MNKFMLTAGGLVLSASAAFADADPIVTALGLAADEMKTSLQTVMASALILFVVIYGVRLMIKGFKAVAK